MIKFKKILFTFALLPLAMSCNNKADKAVASNKEKVTNTQESAILYKVNTSESVIQWTGFKPTGSHTGTINIESGMVYFNYNNLKSGSFTIDMNSIKDNDSSKRLEGHLKSADFFDVENFASATFDITGFEKRNGKSMLSGNLKLKDIENNITFPVTESRDDDTYTLISEVFTIDRSKWNVRYGSKSFFDDLGDKFIDNDIELKVIVKATKS